MQSSVPVTSKRARIYINRSAGGLMKYNIYKFTNEKPYTDIAQYSGLEPYSVVDEEFSSIETYHKEGVVPNINSNTNDLYDVVTLPVDFMYSISKFDINFKCENGNVKITPLIRDLVIEEFHVFLNDRIYFSSTDIKEIEDYIVYNEGNCFLISKSITEKLTDMTLSFEEKVINYIDHYDSHGSFTPDFDIEEDEFTVKFTPKKDLYNIYHYACIAVYPDNTISQLSNVATITLAYDNVGLTRFCYASDHRAVTDNTFYLYKQEFANEPFIERKEDLLSRTVPLFPTNDITRDDSYLTSFNSRTVIVPNPYHESMDHLNRRHYRTLRFTHYHEDGVIKDESYEPFVFYRDNMETLPIDMMKVLRMDVTRMSDENKYRPLDENTNGVEVLKVFVRNGGVYHDEYANYPFKDKVEFLSSCTGDIYLKVKDTATQYQDINYTIYLYDANSSKNTGQVGVF